MKFSKSPKLLLEKSLIGNGRTFLLALTQVFVVSIWTVDSSVAQDLGVRFINGMCSVNAFDPLYNKTCSSSDTNSLLCSIAKGQFNPIENRPTYQLFGDEYLNTTPWMECSQIGPDAPFPEGGITQDIQGSVFRGVDYSNKVISGILFATTKIEKSKFNKSKFSETVFVGSRIRSSTFTDAVFESVVFSGSNVEDSSFEGTNFKNITYSRNEADSSEAFQLKNVKFGKAHFENVEFKEMSSNSSLDFTSTVMDGAVFENLSAFSKPFGRATHEVEEEIDATGARWTNVSMNIEKGTLNLSNGLFDKVTLTTTSDVDLTGSTVKHLVFVGLPKSVKLFGAHIENLETVRSEIVDKKPTYFPIYFANIECTKVGTRTVYDFSIAPIIATKKYENGIETPITDAVFDFKGSFASRKFIESHLDILDNTGNREDCKKEGAAKLQKALEVQGLKVTD